MFHADGEVATAKAAEKHGVRMALSQLTTSTFEDVREAAPTSAKCLQLYVWRDRALLKEVLDRAKEVGFTSLALTADFSWVGNRERETKTGFTVPPSYSVQQCVDAARSPAWTFDFMSRVPYGYKAVPDADFPAESLVDFIAQQMKPEFDWKDAEWLCSEWGDQGKVALKGVARGEDAKRAVETGFDTVWVSNHGGRQLESSVAPFDVLPEVRKAVGPDVEVIMDGGVRRGIDVVKALARGADSVASAGPTCTASRRAASRAWTRRSRYYRRTYTSPWACWAAARSPSSKLEAPSSCSTSRTRPSSTTTVRACNPISARRRRKYRYILPPPLVNLLGSAGEFVFTTIHLLSTDYLPCARGSVVFLPAASRIARSRSLSGASAADAGGTASGGAPPPRREPLSAADAPESS